jgi:NADPH2:quinone reductase
MRAVQQLELTGPRGTHVVEVPDPTLGASEVLVDVAAGSLNFPDVLLSYGKYQFKPEPPFTLGGEFAGTVSAVGASVTGFAPGDRVAGTMIHGAFAEKLAVAPETLVKLPPEVPLETAAATLLTYATTRHALVDRAALRAGETLLVLGAAGGVGTAAIELGKLAGARVLAAASTEEKLALCRSLGADETILYSKEDLKERVKVLTAGKGADVIYDAVGGPYAEPALRAIAWEGRYLVVGFASGEIPKIPLNLTLLKGCQIVGVFWGSFAMREPARNRAHAEAIFADVARGALRPAIDVTLPMTEAREALLRMESRAVKGKVVLTWPRG